MIIHRLSTSGLTKLKCGFRGIVQMSLQHRQTQRINHHFGKPGQKITDTFLLSPPKDDWTSFTQPHCITLDISVTGWAYSQFPSCKASNFQTFSPDTFLHILCLGSCPVINSTGPQWTSHLTPDFPWVPAPPAVEWDGTGQRFAPHFTHSSQMPEIFLQVPQNKPDVLRRKRKRI